MPSDLATSRRGARREGGGDWAARVHNLVAGGLKVGEEGGIGVEGEKGWRAVWKGVKKQEVEAG
jgi:hypothetical protein